MKLKLLSSFFIFVVATAFAENCIEKRNVFDVGSGTTKLGVLLVDKCRHHSLSFEKTDVEHLKFQKCLEQSIDKSTLSDDCIEQGIKGMRLLLERNNLDCLKKDKCAGIATAWARNAKNADELLNEWQKLGVAVKVISQDAEGVFAFRSALMHPKVKKTANLENVAILDVGGGSFQVGVQNKNEVNIFYGKFGVFSLRKLIDAELGVKAAKNTYYSIDELPRVLKAAVDLIRPEMRKDIALLPKIKNRKLAVFGVGRLFVNAFMQEMQFNNIITKGDLVEFIRAISILNGEEVAKKYPQMAEFFIQHAQIAAIMVYAIIESLGVDQLEVIDARLFDYIALDKEVWAD
jgi:exopolyphosphatase/guanosine-5'-triphosphate,3'-diphosphate pyrophosphatase